MASLLLAGAALAAVPSVTGTSSTCGLVVDQDDARSQRDAGASPSQAVQLPYEDEFPASISYPQGTVVDAEDWFHFSWESNQEHHVMVNVTTRVLGLTYMTDQRLPTALGLEAYEPGAEEPAYEAQPGETLEFDTDQTEWFFRVFLPDTEPVDSCPTTQTQDSSAIMQTYNKYIGCDPHCIDVQTG